MAGPWPPLPGTATRKPPDEHDALLADYYPDPAARPVVVEPDDRSGPPREYEVRQNEAGRWDWWARARLPGGWSTSLRPDSLPTQAYAVQRCWAHRDAVLASAITRLTASGASVEDGALVLHAVDQHGREVRIDVPPTVRDAMASVRGDLPPWDVAQERDRSRALLDMLEQVEYAVTLGEAKNVAARRSGYGPVPELTECKPPSPEPPSAPQGGPDAARLQRVRDALASWLDDEPVNPRTLALVLGDVDAIIAGMRPAASPPHGEPATACDGHGHHEWRAAHGGAVCKFCLEPRPPEAQAEPPHGEPGEPGEWSPNTPEPPPKPSTMTPAWDLVMADIRERDAMGTRKYGQRLTPGDGRRTLVDLYQELLDAVVYARKLLAEEEAARTQAPEEPLSDDELRELGREFCEPTEETTR